VKQLEENSRSNLISQEINSVFTKHCTIVNKFIHLNDSANEVKNGDVSQISTKSDTTNAGQRKQSFQKLQASTEDLFLVFSEFRDTVDIRLGKFVPKFEMFKTTDLVKEIEHSIDQRQH